MKQVFVLVLLVSMLIPLGPSSAAPPPPPGPEAPETNFSLQFDGSNDFVTFGRATSPIGALVSSPTWRANQGGDPFSGGYTLQFNGSSQYVSYGPAPFLGAQQFTLETWFNWTGGGVTTGTGTGGLTAAYPLVTKGRGEAEGSNVDMNYFLGIQNNKLAADLEECDPTTQTGCPSGGTAGLNHPAYGSATITTNTWHHAAVTYDGRYWQFYLDGSPDGPATDVGATRYPRWDSIQHAGLASAMTSTGVAAGYFQGILDEARVWNYARSAAEIQASYNQEIASATGLLGRWGMNEGTGSWAYDTSVPGLGVQTFTLETWFNWTGGGVTTSTGTGGLTAVYPLIAKGGRGEGDGATLDINYILGIDSGKLGADFEECNPNQAGCPTGGTAGLNHSAHGTTTITTNTWHHAAVTYDGRYWKFYLDGVPDGTSDVTATRYPRWDSIQHAALGTSMSSAGAAAGYFQGVMDEARIWDYARSAAEILASYNQELTSGAGLIGRWGLNEGSGTTANDSTAPYVNGTLTNGPLWVCGKFATNCGLQFDGTNDYVTFGANLNASSFTLEAWISRAPGGATMSTGTGGFDGGGGRPNGIYPVVTKGMGEGDTPANINMNYFLGITVDGAVGADFEDSSGGVNHPVWGTSIVPVGGWHHIAATYSSTDCWKLYLDGSAEAMNGTVCPGATPESTSIQHAGLAAGLGSTGQLAAGFLSGAIDEARIWNVVRTEAEIQAAINQELTSGTGLIGRWGMNENQGTTINDSTDPYVNGTLTNGPYWVTGAPFNITFNPPDGAPSNLAATLAPGSQIDLAWTDGSTNESAFAVDYALGPACDTWSSLGTSSANSTSFRHWNTAMDTQYCYRVRATNAWGQSAWSNTATAITPESYSALSLGRDRAYVYFGDASSLDIPQFTLEAWFRREGPGVSTTTGTNGVANAIPLISNGAQQAENTDADINYIFCIDSASNKLCADLEEGAGGSSPSLNHPVYGTTAIQNNVWYHGAVTYDGSTWNLYLNGSLEGTLVVGQPANAANTSANALGTSLQTDGDPFGFFDGSLDEVRIWNVARTQAEIRSTMNAQIAEPTSGLVARWALDEHSGTTVSGSAGTAIDGSIYPSSNPTGWNWTADAPFNATLRPNVPVLFGPADGATGVPVYGPDEHSAYNHVELAATVTDPDTPDNLTVTFYGRPACATAPNFSVVALPDTQYETAQTNGGTRAMFDAQTAWILSNRTARNIVYVTHLGDIVDTYSDTAQWDVAGKLTDPKGALTALDDAGMPYGLALGNHDGAPSNTANFNSYFGISRFSGRPYYGGHYGSDNDNNYGLFSAGDMDFIVVHVEYGADAATRAWANSVLQAYPTRRAIVVTHNLLTGNTTPASFTTEGQALYDALKDNANLFLMLGGHLDTEVRRTDTYNGHTVYSLRSDYQFSNGGNGWLRIMEFQPQANQIQVYTYSPYIDQWDTDAGSQFTLPYDMEGQDCAPWTLIGTKTNIASGATTGVFWGPVDVSSEYQWYVTVDDGTYTISSSIWSFTTGDVTGITLGSFRAAAAGDGIRVTWETLSEVDTAGFNLWRSEAADGGYVKLNGALIAAQGGPTRPASYAYHDPGLAVGRTYYYKLEEVDTSGRGALHGPVWATAGRSVWVWLPLVSK